MRYSTSTSRDTTRRLYTSLADSLGFDAWSKQTVLIAFGNERLASSLPSPCRCRETLKAGQGLMKDFVMFRRKEKRNIMAGLNSKELCAAEAMVRYFMIKKTQLAKLASSDQHPELREF